MMRRLLDWCVPTSALTTRQSDHANALDLLDAMISPWKPSTGYVWSWNDVPTHIVGNEVWWRYVPIGLPPLNVTITGCTS